MSKAFSVLMGWLWIASIQAATQADSAVALVFKQADASLAHFVTLSRTAVTEELHLVIAIGSPKKLPAEQNSWIWWSEDRKIGLFLQEKMRPGRVYLLGIKAGFPDCAAHIERVTATDSVISCRGEKSARYPNQKWVYDVRAKRLLGQFSYQPFAMYRAFPSADGAIFIGSDTQRLVAIKHKANGEPAFHVLGETEARPWIARVKTTVGTQGLEARREVYIEIDKEHTPSALPPLPRTTYDQFAAARPQRVKDGYLRAGIEIEDSIGPWQQEDGRIWFGKTFYDGEGHTGVGGFGYFALNERNLHLFSPPEIADWSVSAIHVGLEVVWMALVRDGEYGSSSGGLLRFDRHSGALRRVALPDIGSRFIQTAEKLLVATDFGIAVVEGDPVKRYFVDRTTDGRLRVVPANRQ